ncbi:hypothetical protein ACF8GB_01670 [Pseudomonas sp. xss_4]|uniref:hypothetical protein n=1 Tax=Pseudomonas sp. xss_4 TaxID=3367216 RepID=UPI00370AF737
MDIFRVHGISFMVFKSSYITRRFLNYETEETTELCYSAEYEALSSCRNHYFYFEVPSSSDAPTPQPPAIEAEFRRRAIEYFNH